MDSKIVQIWIKKFGSGQMPIEIAKRHKSSSGCVMYYLKKHFGERYSEILSKNEKGYKLRRLLRTKAVGKCRVKRLTSNGVLDIKKLNGGSGTANWHMFKSIMVETFGKNYKAVLMSMRPSKPGVRRNDVLLMKETYINNPEKTANQIAESFNISDKRFYFLMSKHFPGVFSGKRPVGRRPNVYTEEQIEQVKAMYSDPSKTLEDIHAETGITRADIYSIRNKHFPDLYKKKGTKM